MKRLLLAAFVALSFAGALLLSPLGLLPDSPQPRPVPPAWFCRVYSPAQLATYTGPACTQLPATYRPPWPYLGPHGGVVYPATPEPSP